MSHFVASQITFFFETMNATETVVIIYSNWNKRDGINKRCTMYMLEKERRRRTKRKRRTEAEDDDEEEEDEEKKGKGKT